MPAGAWAPAVLMSAALLEPRLLVAGPGAVGGGDDLSTVIPLPRMRMVTALSGLTFMSVKEW